MNEFQAAFGFLQLIYIDMSIEEQTSIAQNYREQLKEIPGITILDDITGVKHCYSYFPVLIAKEITGRTRDEVYDYLKSHNIFTRRYFYPLITYFPVYRELDSARPENLPVAGRIAENILCLPIYPELSFETTKIISKILGNVCRP